MTFSFTQGTSLTLLQELKAGKVDLAICSYIADEPDIDFIPVIQQELVVVTAKDHPLARLYEHEVDLVETIHYPYIYFSENSGLRPFIDNVFMQQKLVPEIACYVDEDTAMAGLVSIDYGIAIMPRITALSYYNVHILKIKNTIPPRYIYLATMKDKGSLRRWSHLKCGYPRQPEDLLTDGPDVTSGPSGYQESISITSRSLAMAICPGAEA